MGQDGQLLGGVAAIDTAYREIVNV
jgi:hypothetical protein